MNNRVLLKDLPKPMADRSVTARKLASQSPQDVDIDDEMLPWIFDDESQTWLSFDGNYSATSPREKRERQKEKEVWDEGYTRKKEQWVSESYYVNLLWSKIRQDVLARDNNVCQICKDKAKTRLHVHHILKKECDGTDHFDNLITVCPKCHALADRKGYNPDWTKRPSK